MAITTIRDLAFKISMNVQIENLKKADKMVDDFKGKVTSMQRSVSKDIGVVNRNFDNIRTFKAVKRINDITKATKDLNTAVKGATGVGNGATGGTNIQQKVPKIFNGKEMSTMSGLIGGFSKILTIVQLIRMAWRSVQRLFNDSINSYIEYEKGLVRVQTYFANSLKYRKEIYGEDVARGAKTFEDYKRASQASVDVALANARKVADIGVIGFNDLQMFMGQLASFQIDTDKWFGGKTGEDNLKTFADLMTAVQVKTGSIGEALRMANMLGKADVLGFTGQLKRNGIVTDKVADQILKLGNRGTNLSTILKILKENVGNLNSELAKTPAGKMVNLQNKIKDKYVEIGKSMIHVKNDMLELFLKTLPIIKHIMIFGGNVFRAILWIITKVVEGIKWLFTPVDELTASLNVLRYAVLALGTAFMFSFFPVFSLIALLLLAIEDIWVGLNGGESYTKDLMDFFDEWVDENIKAIKKIVKWIQDIPSKIKGAMLELHIFMVNIFKDMWDSITKSLDSFLGKFMNKLNSMLDKIKSLKKYIPFIGDDIQDDKTVKLNKASDILNEFAITDKPTADINNPTDRPNNSTNKNVNLELKIENGAIQQDFSGREYLTLEDIQSATTKSLEELFNSGLGGLMIEGGILQ